MKNISINILLFAIHLNDSVQQNIHYDKNIELDYIGLHKDVVTEKSFSYKKDNGDEDEDPGNPDNYAIIERPCPVYDRFCIRKYFAQHSDCKIVPGPVKEPFYLTEFQLNPVVTNISITVADILFSGFNGRVEEFFVNKATGNLVFSVFFEGLKGAAGVADLRFNRNGAEPVEAITLAAFDFVKLAITVVFPNFKNMRLENAEVNGHLEDPLPPFILLPNIINFPDPTAAADPTTVAELAAIFANIPTAAIESVATVSPIFANIFIQKNICDFGVPINRI